MEECQNAAKLLQESGQRLDLGGHWWRDKGGMMVATHHEKKLYLEAMTRQYCQSVEVSSATIVLISTALCENGLYCTYSLVPKIFASTLAAQFKIERQHKDINELESLCGFLEKKLVTGSDY
jgi:hypothetical protein